MRLDTILNLGKGPFQSFGSIFRLHNMLVHGKTHYLEEENEQTITETEKPVLPQAKWEKLVNLENAVSFSEDTEAMIETINPKVGFRTNLMYAPERGSWSISPIEND